MLEPPALKTSVSSPLRPVPLDQISTSITEAATSDTWRPGHHLGPRVLPPSPFAASHFERIQWALERARSKTFVRMMKPFRRLFRNQGAVNDNLITAVHHLAAQNQELIDEINRLAQVIAKLRGDVVRRRWQTRPEVRPIRPFATQGKTSHNSDPVRR